MRRARCPALDYFLDIPLVADDHQLVIVPRAPRIYVKKPAYPMMVLESAEEIS